jgi:hypothetical protein
MNLTFGEQSIRGTGVTVSRMSEGNGCTVPVLEENANNRIYSLHKLLELIEHIYQTTSAKLLALVPSKKSRSK